jgi:hypothetical protein
MVLTRMVLFNTVFLLKHIARTSSAPQVSAESGLALLPWELCPKYRKTNVAAIIASLFPGPEVLALTGVILFGRKPKERASGIKRRARTCTLSAAS